MKQVICNIQSLSELEGCMERFRRVCPAEYSSILVSIFTHWTDREVLRKLTEKISRRLPRACIVGSTSSGGIMEGKLEMHNTVLSFMVFEDTKLLVRSFSDRTDSVEDGASFLEECRNMEHLVGIEFLATLRSFNAQGFFGQLAELSPEVAVFGGGADTYAPREDIYVFTDDAILDAGMVAVCFLSPSLSIRVEAGIGWKPLGTPMKITATHGNLIIRELDNKPAVSIYEKYLKIYPNERFHQNVLTFPLMLERDGVSLARLPDAYMEDGSLVFNASCNEGEYVRLAYGDTSEILEHTRRMQDNLMSDTPEAILIFSCVTRRIFLQGSVKYELHRYQDIAPVAGLYTHGEINRQGGRIQMLNMTLVSVGFRESPMRGEVKKLSQSDDIEMEMNDNMSLAQRLACFITVTAEELEIANRKLVVLACQDRLTELFNRGEIESRLKQSVKDMRIIGKPVSVIMLDLDNFKSINDTFGHEAGDNVLKTMAKVLMESIRQSDAAGRWGGEEFLVVLPGVKLEEACHVAERIRRTISQKELLPDRPVTASLGVAEILPGEDCLAFYHRLDENLYTAKKSGKNRVVS